VKPNRILPKTDYDVDRLVYWMIWRKTYGFHELLRMKAESAATGEQRPMVPDDVERAEAELIQEIHVKIQSRQRVLPAAWQKTILILSGGIAVGIFIGQIIESFRTEQYGLVVAEVYWVLAILGIILIVLSRRND
jgi:hypothetical protein